MRPGQSTPPIHVFPIHVFSAVQRASGGVRMTDEQIQYCREMPARELDEEIPVAEEYALHRRAGVRVKS